MCSESARWAKRAASEIIENYADAVAIETANYRECSFIIEAAKLALVDDRVAARVGELMEAPRALDIPSGEAEVC